MLHKSLTLGLFVWRTLFPVIRPGRGTLVTEEF
jgi:hypothetical protein